MTSWRRARPNAGTVVRKQPTSFGARLQGAPTNYILHHSIHRIFGSLGDASRAGAAHMAAQAEAQCLDAWFLS